MRFIHFGILAALAFISANVRADVFRSPPFLGSDQETWDNSDSAQNLPLAFDGLATLSAGVFIYAGPNPYFIPGFGLGSYPARTQSGLFGLGKAYESSTPVTITFNHPIIAFGGYWAATTGYTSPYEHLIQFHFIDANGFFVGADFVVYSEPNHDGTLEWIGWSFSHPVSRIEYIANYVANDSLTATRASLEISPPTITCSAPSILECTNGTGLGTVHAEVQDSSGYSLLVVWKVDGTATQTNYIPSGGATTTSNVTFTTRFGIGDHVVTASASNGHTDSATCNTSVSVRDATPPWIVSAVATPDMLWPPNHRMIAVRVVASAADNCDPSPVIRIKQVTSNEPENHSEHDWKITGPLSVDLRAERFGNGGERVYTILLECADGNGNTSASSVRVTVSHDRGHDRKPSTKLSTISSITE